MSHHLSRKIAELVVLEPVKRDVLAPEAIERACELIRGWARSECTAVQRACPEADAVAAEIADLEALIEGRPSRASTLRRVIEDLRTKQASLRRSQLRKVQGLEVGKVPAEEAYKAAVADLAGTLHAANVEAARAALRSLIGSVPVFQEGGKIYGRISLNAVPLFGASNPTGVEWHGSGGPLGAL